jgi:general secretion pathway protein G
MTIRQATRQATRRAAFTLMEMLVVVAIIVIVAGMAVPAVTGYLEQAKIQTAQAGIQNIVKAIKAYELHYGAPPAQLNDLLQPNTDQGIPAYLEQKDLIDPWSQPYYYEREKYLQHPTGRPFVASGGPNQQGNNSKLTSWHGTVPGM